MKKVNIPIRDNDIKDITAGDIAGFGKCTDDGYYSNFIITIRNDLLQDNCDLTELKQVVIHELIHTCPRCWSHGKTWIKYATIMNDSYGYTLLDGKDDDSFFHLEKPILHRYKCPKCSNKYDSRSEMDEGFHICFLCRCYYREIE